MKKKYKAINLLLLKFGIIIYKNDNIQLYLCELLVIIIYLGY